MIFSPHGPSAPRPNPPQKPTDAGEPDVVIIPRVAVEHVHADVRENPRNLPLFPCLEVVISEHGNDRDLHLRQVLGENARFVGEPVVGEVAPRRRTSAESAIWRNRD